MFATDPDSFVCVRSQPAAATCKACCCLSRRKGAQYKSLVRTVLKSHLKKPAPTSATTLAKHTQYIVAIEVSNVCATDFASTMEAMNKYGVVAYMRTWQS